MRDAVGIDDVITPPGKDEAIPLLSRTHETVANEDTEEAVEVTTSLNGPPTAPVPTAVVDAPDTVAVTLDRPLESDT